MAEQLAHDNQERAVLTAFRRAQAAGRPPAECYRAGVLEWRRLHPEQSPEYSAKRAVSLILSVTKSELLSVDEPHSH